MAKATVQAESHPAKRTVRALRDFQQLEQRRRLAARLFAAGKLTQAAIARVLRVSRQSVSRWYVPWKRGGVEALRAAGRAGRKPKLNVQERELVDQALRKGARAHGFRTDLWSLPRIARVIERLTGVCYHPGHVWRILRAMQWSLQRPAKQARERNPEKVQQWMKDTWPAIKKKPADERLGSSSKMKVASLNVPLSAALGPRKGKPRS